MLRAAVRDYKASELDSPFNDIHPNIDTLLTQWDDLVGGRVVVVVDVVRVVVVRSMVLLGVPERGRRVDGVHLGHEVAGRVRQIVRLLEEVVTVQRLLLVLLLLLLLLLVLLQLMVRQRCLVQRLDQLVAAHRVAEVRCHSHRVVRPDAAVAQPDAARRVRDAVPVRSAVPVRHDAHRRVEVVVAEQVVAAPRSKRVGRSVVDVTDAALLLLCTTMKHFIFWLFIACPHRPRLGR